ncbi:MAG: hypothetical protein N2444_04265, partial [Methylocystis sp.]|nr:hypothetical protein [Methylocystis sp.]
MSVWTRPALPALLAPSRLSPLMKAALGAAGGLVAASAGFTVYALLAPENDGAIATQSEWKAPLPAVVELGAPKSASGDVQTLSRPIFNKDRRPTKSASAAAPTTTKIAEAPTGLAVSAIVKRGGEAQTYLTTGGGGGAWRKIGEEFEGWTVSAIEQDEVTLRNGEGSARLQLYNACL